MKKKIALIFTLLVVSSMTFAACGSNGDMPSTDSVPSVDSEQTSEQTSETMQTSDSEPSDNSETEQSQSEAAAETDSSDADEAETYENTSNPLKPIIERVTAESEWPALDMVTDSTILSEFFLLDSGNENYKNLIVMQCPISAVMSEIIIIEANDVTAAEEDLDARRQKAIDQDAWYPNDVEMANSSIVGTNGDYAYFIIGESAEETEKIINDYIDSL